MPLYDCSECGAAGQGYWHCRDTRENRRRWIIFWLKHAGILALSAAAVFISRI
jgi:hypothetical protein